MAKKDRYNGAVEAFGSQALGTERTVFGEVTQSNDIDDQQTADFLRGWGIVGVNDLPTKQDFNACAYTLSYLIAYLYQAGVNEWNATQDYHQYHITNLDGVLYTSLQNANTGHLPTSTLGVWWQATAGVTGDMFKADNLSGLASYITARSNMGILQRLGTNIASAATTDIGSADSHYVKVTGTTTITALGTGQARDFVIVEFTGALTLTHNAASLILPGAANIVTVAGDVGIFVRFGAAGANTWKCANFIRANGQAPSGMGARTNIASAATTTLDQTTNCWAITGTTTITALGSSASIANPIHLVRFTGALTLTHNGTSLILPTSANILTAAGDTALMEYLGSGNWRCLDYMKADGTPLTPTLVGRSYTEYATYVSAVAAVIPEDDTIPQNTEGLEIFNVSYTMKKSTNRLRVSGHINLSASSTTNGTVAIFQDSVANALHAVIMGLSGAASSLFTVPFVFEYAPGTASAIAIKIRVGTSSVNVRVNGIAARVFGGVGVCNLLIEEIQP